MSIDRNIVEEQLKSIGESKRILTRKEYKFLPEILADGETIKGTTAGFYDGKTWVIVVTDMRILFLDRGLFYGVHQFDMPLSQISAISQTIGLFFGQIEIATSGGKQTISKIPRKDVTKISSLIAAMIHGEIVGSPLVQSQTDQLPPDVANQLERIEILWQKGALTDSEFERAKAKIIGS